ncbi:Peroxiredoxin-6 [Dactylellina cionopaga]|nr:Peroxiredoxin-6 [Dactylellina cionopaga]
MSSILARTLPPRRAISSISFLATIRAYHAPLTPETRHLYPGEKLNSDVVPLVDKLVTPFSSGTLPLRDIWKVVFTASRARDPVSSTNLKSFAEYRDDLLARDTVAICLVPGQTRLAREWVGDIVRSSGLDEDLISDHKDAIATTALGFPVIADPFYKIHQQLGFIPRLSLAPEKESTTPPHHLLHIISPDNTIRLTQILPSTIGFNVLDIVRTIHALQTADDYDILMPADWTPGKDALMPVGRMRRKEAVAKMQSEVESAAAPLAPEGVEGSVLRDKDEDGEEFLEEGEYEEEVIERMPPGETWEVLPYLRYVRIDDRVDNSASVIGYENMKTDLLRAFEKFKEEKAEKKVVAKTERHGRKRRNR